MKYLFIIFISSILFPINFSRLVTTFDSHGSVNDCFSGDHDGGNDYDDYDDYDDYVNEGQGSCTSNYYGYNYSGYYDCSGDGDCCPDHFLNDGECDGEAQGL